MIDAWMSAARRELGIADDEIPTEELLDLARVAAHNVARPAAPLTTFLAGLAAGRAGGTPADVHAAVSALTGLAERWTEPAQ